MTEFKPGDTVSHYRILGQLGYGGHGVVFRARDSRLERDVALKTVRPSDDTPPELVERLRREAKRLASFQHPNIVSVYDVDEIDGIVLLAMELVGGGTLRDEIAAGTPTLDRWFDIALGLSEALAVAHREGVIHRDLKPENVLVDVDGRPKLADFGLSLLLVASVVDSDTPTTEAPLTRQGMVVGTPAYMSPEQLRGDKCSPTSDTFSLCVVLHEYLTGQHPFAVDGGRPSADAILHSPPAPLSGNNTVAELPQDLVDLIMAGLDKDPRRRPRSAQEMASAIRQSRQPASLASATRWHLLASIIVVLAGVIAAAVLLTRLPPPEGIDPAFHASVAVLPCQLENPSDDLSYLAAGVPDSVITSLTRLPSLRVVPADNLIGIVDRAPTSPEVAESLRVQLVVSCRMRFTEDHVELAARIYDSNQRSIVWAELLTSGLDASEIVALRSQLASAIVQHANLTTLEITATSVEIPSDLDPTTYRNYMQGRVLYQRYERSSNLQAMKLFREAVQRAPNFADAHVALAQTYFQMTSKQWDTNPSWLSFAYEEARAAVEIDPANADAYAALGFILFSQRNPERALAQYRRALEISPRHADAGIYLAGTLAQLGRNEEARDQLNEWLRLYPDYWKAFLVKASLDLAEGNVKEAAESAGRVILLLPNFLRGYTIYAGLLLQLDEEAAALEILKQAEGLLGPTLSEYKELSRAYGSLQQDADARRILVRGVARAERSLEAGQDVFDAYRYLGWMAASLGDEQRSREAIRGMLSEEPNSALTWAYAAQIQALLGDADESLASLRRTKELEPLLLPWAMRFPEMRPLRDDPRFQALDVAED